MNKLMYGISSGKRFLVDFYFMLKKSSNQVVGYTNI